MLTQAQLRTIAANMEAAAGATTQASPSRAGYWRRIAAAAEDLANFTSTAAFNIAGYQLRTAKALEAISGTSGDIEGTGYEGKLKRIVDALDVLNAASTTGRLERRFYIAALDAGGGVTPTPSPGPTPTPTPTPTMLLDGIATAPTIRPAGARTATTGQTGPIASVAVGAGTPFDVASAAEADAGGATKVVGFYDGNGNLMSFDARVDYVNDNGLIAADNNTGVERTAAFATNVRTALDASPGYTLMCIYGKTPAQAGTAAQLVAISSDTSSTTTLFNISSNAQGNVSGAYRRLHADTAVTRLAGAFNAGFEILDFSVSYNESGTRRIRMGRNGASMWKEDIATADGAATAGAPAAASVRIPIGGRFYGALLWKGALSDADLDTLRVNAKSQFATLYGNSGLSDASSTWWSRNAARSPDGTRVVVGFSHGSGLTGTAAAIGVAEYDAVTRKLLDVKYLDAKPLYTVDEHSVAAVAFTPAGKLLVWVVAHNNAIDGTSATANRILLCVSADGRVKNLSAGNSITLSGGTAGSGANYAQPIIVDENTWYLWTNQDNQRAWRFIKYTGGDPASGVNCVNVVANLPAGMTTNAQLYSLLTRMSGNTFRGYTQPHSANVRNINGYFDIDMATGVVTANGSNVGNAFTAYSTSAALIDLSVTSLPVAYDPGAGNSFRLMDAVGDEIMGVRFVNADNTGRQHVVVKAGVAYDLGDPGQHFGGATVGPYYPGIMKARETHSGSRYYRVFNDGAFTGTNTLERLDIPALGGTINRATVLTTNTQRLLRPLLVDNAGADFAGVVARGTYTTFDLFRTAFVPFAGA